MAPPTEEIPTKPPVATMPGVDSGTDPSVESAVGESVSPDLSIKMVGDVGHIAAPNKVDMILAIVAALVVIGMVAVLYLKVLGPLGAE